MKLRSTIWESGIGSARPGSNVGPIADGIPPEDRTKPHLVISISHRPSKVAFLSIRRVLAALPLVLTFLVAPVFAQPNDGSFIEFNRTLVPTPAELFRTLSVFDSDGITGTDPQSRFKASVLKQLEQSGRELFSQMSPEQKKNAREFADNFLSENGLESEEGKALMNQLGIPSEMQSELAQQVKGWDPEDKKRFASLAEMFAQDQSRGLNQRQSGRSGNRSLRSGPGGRSNSLSNDRTGQAKDLGDLFQKAAGNLGTDSQQKAAASTFKRIVNGAKNTLSRSSDGNAKPTERLTSRFDRLLVKAVNRSLEAKSSSDLNLPESVESAFENVLGKVQDSINNKRKTKAAIPPDSVQKRTFSGGQGVSQSNVNVANSRSNNGSNNDVAEFGSDSSGDMMESLGEFPKINPSRMLLIMALIGLAGFMIYIGWQYLVNESTTSSKRRLSRRFRSSRIRSPNDLVEAVDQAIVRKFGVDARWWNANHAKEILCSSAPQFQASISDLLHDYVRARYSLNEPVLTDVVQKQHKSTLKELSNLRSESKSAKESDSGNEG